MELTLSTAASMNSREIARLTGKRHDHVCRDIEEQLGTPGIVVGGLPRFGGTYKSEQTGQTYRCYILPKRECLILASGYDVVLRAKIIDRWTELETAAIPQSFAAALRLAAEQAEAIEEQQRQISAADSGILYRLSGKLTPAAEHMAAGRFEVKAGESRGHAYTQARFTPAGVEWITGRIAKAQK